MAGRVGEVGGGFLAVWDGVPSVLTGVLLGVGGIAFLCLFFIWDLYVHKWGCVLLYQGCVMEIGLSCYACKKTRHCNGPVYPILTCSVTSCPLPADTPSQAFCVRKKD